MNYRKHIASAIAGLALIFAMPDTSNAQCDTIIADFSSNAPRCTGESVDFVFTQNAYATVTYDWNFGSGASPATSTAQNPSGIVYSTPGLKLVTLTITHPGLGCTDTKTSGINIVETPNPSFTDNGPQCEEAEVDFTYTGSTGTGWVYSWDFGTSSNPAVSSAQSPTGVKYFSPGTKNVTLTVTNGSCNATVNQNVTINNKPDAGFSNAASSCTGDSVTFTNNGSTGLTYSWNFGVGASPATSTSENPADIFYSSDGVKNVQQIVTQGACSDTSLQSINIIQTPAPNFTSNAPQCEGAEVNLTYTGTTGTGWTYAWDFGNGSSPSVSSAQNPAGILYTGSGTKTVSLTVTNQICAENVSQAITINPTPVSGLSSSSPACTNDSIDFSNTGTTGLAYSWNFGSGASPATSTTENPIGIMYSTSGIKNITQIVTQGTCTDTAFGTVSVTETPQPAFTHNAPQCEGAEVNFTYTGSTGTGWTYLWDFGTGASPSLSSTNSPSGVMYTGSGSKTVTLTVTNQLCAETTTQNLTINFTPVSGFSSNAPGCTGDSVNFLNNGTSGITYAWDFGAGATPATATTESPSGIIYSTPGIKTVRQIHTQGTCTDTTINFINIRETPAPNFTDNGPRCEGADVNFTYLGSTGNGWTYAWDFGNGSNPSTSTALSPQGVKYTGAGNKNVTLTVTNQGCSDTAFKAVTIDFQPMASMSTTAPSCTGDTVLFTNTGTTGVTGTTYTWNFGNGSPATSSLENPGGVTFANAGVESISLAVSVGACSDTVTEVININETPSISITSTAPVCAGESVAFANQGSTGSRWSYIWDFGAGANPNLSTSENPGNVKYGNGGSKTVSLTVSDANCSNSDTVTININSLPVSNAGPDTTICADRCVNIGDSAVAGYSYQWFPASTLDNDTSANPLACPKASINTYVVTTTDGNNCMSMDTVVVTMLQSAVANAGPDIQGCEGDSIQIGAALIEGQTYTWTPSEGLSNDTAPSPIAAPDSTTIYTVSVSYKGCEVVSDEVVFTVYKNPVVSAGDDVQIARGETTQLLATGGIMYQWSPALGLSNSGIFNPVASPDETTTYVVLVTDQNSCQNEDSMTVTVVDADTWAPTAFTPNGDGNNDIFYVRTNGAVQFTMLVFNRSGEVIYSSTNPDNGWDGTRQGSGEKMPSGAYVYSVKASLSDGTPVVENGMVNLIR